MPLHATVAELQQELHAALAENERMRKLLTRIDETDTGIVNWLQANTDIVEVKLYTHSSTGDVLNCWHFIVHKGKSIRDVFLERMDRHKHGSS